MAQLIIEQAKTPDVELAENLTITTQQDRGFGSTKKLHHNDLDNLYDICIRENIHPRYKPTTASAEKLEADIKTTFEISNFFELSQDLYDNHIYHMVNPRPNDNNLLRMTIEICLQRGLYILRECKAGQSSARIPR